MTPKATKAEIIRRFVTQHAATPDGFYYALAERVGILQGSAGGIVEKMLAAGEVVRVKVKGQRTRLHHTAEASQAWAKRHAPDRTKNKLSLIEQADATRAALLALAARPGGLVPAECLPALPMTLKHRHALAFERAGALFADRVRLPFRYFATLAAAEQSRQASTQAVAKLSTAMMVKKRARQKAREALRRLETGAARVRPYRVTQQQAKPPKAPKVIKPAKPAAPVVERKPYTPPAPRVAAAIVWPAHIQPVCRPWLDRYAVSVPMVRIGEAGFSMTVGGAA